MSTGPASRPRQDHLTSAVVGVPSVARLNKLLEAGRLKLTAPVLDQFGDATSTEDVPHVPRRTHQRPEAGELVLN